MSWLLSKVLIINISVFYKIMEFYDSKLASKLTCKYDKVYIRKNIYRYFQT